MASAHRPPAVELSSAAGRWLIAATVLASGMAFLDTTVVNVALPAIGADLGADVAGLQWILTGYLVTLASLILVGGSLGDHYGRRRVFLVGVVGFAAASVLCALAPNVATLIAARLVQGIGAALLVPGSLAIIEASFVAADRPAAIGAWSGLAGVTTAIGPVLGGWLVDVGSWRWIFLLNGPLAITVVAIALRHVPESADPEPSAFDPLGAAAAAGGLAAATWALINAGERGLTATPVLVIGAVAVTALSAFVVVERRSDHPMLPPSIFSSAQFTAANLVTVVVYAALGTTTFLLVVHLQQVLGYTALQAGLATVPLTLLMLVLSSSSGSLAQRIGPRTQLAAGPALAAVGLALMVRIEAGTGYVTAVLPGVIVLGLGLAATVAPLTSTVLAAVDDHHAGLASGVNNATARTAQLGAIAVVPVIAGLTGDAYQDPALFADGFATAMWIAAGLAAVGGLIGLLAIRNPLATPEPHATAAEPAPAEAAVEPPAVPPGGEARIQCGVEAPALSGCPRSAPETARSRS